MPIPAETRSAETSAGDPRSPRLKSPQSLLRQALRLRRRDLAVSTALTCSHQFGEAMVPVIIGATISHAISTGSRDQIIWWLAVLAADFVLLSFSYRFAARARVRAQEHTAHEVRMWLVERVLRPDGGVSSPPGELLTRSASDADRVGALTRVVASTSAAALVLTVATVLLLRYSLVLGLLIPIGTALLLLVVGRASRRLQHRSATEQHTAGEAAVLAEDLIRGLRVVKGVGAEQAAARNYSRLSRSAMDAAVHAASAEAQLSAVGRLFTGVHLAVIAGTGGLLALSGHMGLGDFVASLGLARFLIGPMSALSDVGPARARALASATRIHEILTVPPAVRAPSRGAEPAPGGVTFDAVTLAGSVPVSFSAPAGRLTGIVADDPAIAAAIPALLAREYDPPSGRVLLGELPVDALTLDDLRATVMVSPHDAALFDGSVAENFGALTSDAQALERGVHAAFADQVVDTLPDGDGTAVGEHGRNLSGGQRQRVALARVLAAEPAVLVLHDPTTAVDAATEDRIAERLRAAREGSTTVIVTTSPALLARCDQVVFLRRDGADLGTPEDLLVRNEDYRTLVTR